MKRHVMLVASALVIAASAMTSCAHVSKVLFESDFEQETDTFSFRDAYGTEWYWGRFEPFHDGGTLKNDTHIVVDPVRPDNICLILEDEAGVLIQVDTRGYQKVELWFDWYTLHIRATSLSRTEPSKILDPSGVSAADTKDRFVGAYRVGELDLFDDGGTADFVEIFGGRDAVQSWWEKEWTEFIREASDHWLSAGPIQIPAGVSSLWIAFWIDDGEAHCAAIDNITVIGLPEENY